MVKIIEKDITTVDKGIIAHGVNCRGVMGAGVAQAIKTKWPKVYDKYISYPTGEDMLGTVHSIGINEELFVVNCYTQVNFGSSGKFADLEAVEKCMQAVAFLATVYGLPVYVPKIGCGLGGLDWETEVLPTIEKVNKTYDSVDIYVCVWEK